MTLFQLVLMTSTVFGHATEADRTVQTSIGRLLTRFGQIRNQPGKGHESLDLALEIYTLRAGVALCEYSRDGESSHSSCLERLQRTKDLVGLCSSAGPALSESCSRETTTLASARDQLENRAYGAK